MRLVTVKFLHDGFNALLRIGYLLWYPGIVTKGFLDLVICLDKICMSSLLFLIVEGCYLV